MRSNKLISAEPINLDAEIFEIRKRKTSIIDRIPVQCAAMILSSAKLHFIDFVSDIAEHMDTEGLRILYMGKWYLKIFKFYKGKLRHGQYIFRIVDG